MSELQQRHEEFLVEERQPLRVESDRLMEEACLAFNSAESDRVKVLKSKLRKEKSKRKREQERNEKLFTVKSHTIFNVSFLLLFGCAGNGKEIRLGGGSAYGGGFSLHRILRSWNFQSRQVKRTPQNSIKEFIIRKLNSLVVVDFRCLFIVACVTGREFTRNFFQLSFPEFDVNVV